MKVQKDSNNANQKYKESADESRRVKNYEVGDFVMVHLHKDRQSSRNYSKLKAKNFGPCEILKKIDENAYLVDLPEQFNISPTFNIFDLEK